MKRCPKCNRTFPEESQKFCTVDGGLLMAVPNIDPSATMRATSADLGLPTETFSSEHAATSRKLPDMAETILSGPPPEPASSGEPSAPLPPAPQPEAVSTEPG